MPTFFIPQEQFGVHRLHGKRKIADAHAGRAARVSHVAKAKLLHEMSHSLVAGNSESFKQGLETVVNIFSQEARVSDAQIMRLRRAISTIQLDQNKEDSKMLSTGDVAKKLGVSNQAIINWIETGKLKAYRSPGGHYRIPVDQFRTTDEQDTITEAIFEKLWAKREGMPPIDEDDLRDL